MLKQLLTSKKFVAAAVGLLTVVLAFVLGKLGVSVPDEKLAEFIGILAVYLLGQGIADHGKEAAKVNLDASRARIDVLKLEMSRVAMTKKK